jgi:hypothetical protein
MDYGPSRVVTCRGMTFSKQRVTYLSSQNAAVRTANVSNAKLMEEEKWDDKGKMGGLVGDVTYPVVCCVVASCWC